MRRLLVMGAVALVVVAAIAIASLVILQPFRPHTSNPTISHTASPTAQIVHQPLPAGDVTNIQDSMNSSDATTQSKAWIPGRRAAYVASVINPLPAGTKLVVDTKSFWYVKDYGEVQATAGSTTYTLHLERFDNQWFIAWTSKK